VCERIEDEFHRRSLYAETWSLLHELHSGMAGDSSIEGQTLRRRLAVLLWHDPQPEASQYFRPALEKIVKPVGAQQGLSEEELRSYGLIKTQSKDASSDI
jgi:hypothetical protein